MSEAKIEFVETVDNSPSDQFDYYGEYPQGTEWTNWDIYRFTTPDGQEFYFKSGKVYNSYGNQDGSAHPVLCKRSTKVINVWE